MERCPTAVSRRTLDRNRRKPRQRQHCMDMRLREVMLPRQRRSRPQLQQPQRCCRHKKEHSKNNSDKYCYFKNNKQKYNDKEKSSKEYIKINFYKNDFFTNNNWINFDSNKISFANVSNEN